MIQVDHQIESLIATGEVVIQPYDPACIQPSSYDFHLSDTFRVFDPQAEVIDPRNPRDVMHEVKVTDGFFVLHPGQFALAASIERFTFAPNIVAQVNGKSSLGRLGLQVHATAGFFDPGWDGVATLELSNVAPLPLRLYPGMKIAQMVFMRSTTSAKRPYGSKGLGSKYQGATGPDESRYHENFANSRTQVL